MTLTTTHPSGEPRRFRARLPNLDGLRAVSVLLVVLFHGRVLHLVGGFIGVSVFFTISGYLLTHRLLAKPLNRQAIVRYWSGRWRRILPAAWTVLLAIVAMEWLAGRTPADATRRLASTAAGLGNWLQLWKGGTYAALFEGGDAMVHYWSLGVEEQAYLVLPLVLAGVVLLRHRLARLGVVTALAAASFAIPFVWSLSVARTYYGTDTRAGEILAGVALAIAHQSGVVPRRAGRVAGGVMVSTGLAGILAIALTVQTNDEFIRRGLLPLLAVLSVLTVHGAVSTPRVLWGALETGPMQFLGAVSYPVYLLHWPIMVGLRWRDVPDPLVAAGGLFGAAILSMPLMHYLETPLRRRATRRVWFGWIATTAAVLGTLALVVQPSTATQFLADLEDDQGNAVVTTSVPPATTAAPATTPGTATADSTGGGTPATTTTVPQLPTVAVFGDSAALSVALLVNGQVPRDEINYVGSSTMLGCGLVHELEPDRCQEVPQMWTDFLAQQPVDVALLLSCQWELVERQVPGAGLQVPGDAELDSIIADGYRDALDVLLSNGADRVAWLLCPEFSDDLGDDAVPEVNRSRDPARVVALNAIIDDVAAEYGDRVVVVDLYTFMQPLTDDGDLRPDGAHFSYDRPNALSLALPGLLAAALAG